MRFRELRRVLQQVVLAGLPALSACDGLDVGDGESLGESCSKLVMKSFHFDLPSPDPSLQFLVESCVVDADSCPALCQAALRSAEIHAGVDSCDVGFAPDRSAAVVEVGYSVPVDNPDCAVAGRRPAGLAAAGALGPVDPVGAWLAHTAWLEAASVHAFIALARELEAHEAPTRLVRAALAAARDEVRHATIVAALALRHGVRPSPVHVAAPVVRSIEAIAVENAAEGCVRETWGAVVALWQAQRAEDPQVRTAMAGIAADELRHAALAWQVDRWAAGRLGDAALARVARARTAAAHALVAAPGSFEPAVSAALGLPDDHEGRALVHRAAAALWDLGAPGAVAAHLTAGGLECVA